MPTIAGHIFAETPAGRCCVSYSSVTGQTCGIPWTHVRTCRQEDVGKTLGLAHHGAPTVMKYLEIRAEADREESKLWEAIMSIGNPSSR